MGHEKRTRKPSRVAAVSEESASSAEELSASVQEVGAAAQEMSRMSEELNKIVSKFKINTERPGHHLRIAA
jgi:methyl-accepting chemotaxis protein